MVFFNYALRKLNTKIVYYGPGLCGKTTNLQWIHDHFEGGEKGKMVSLATEGDRTIFFDLLPLEIGTIRGMDVTLQLYTVPGQVHYNATRQLVLRGADGVVFVADSQRTMKNSNIESLRNLEENLALQGVELSNFPHVLQFNKRDLRDVMGLEEMDGYLNEHSVPFFEAVAIEGIGVEDTLGGIVKLVMRSLRDRYESQGDRLSPTTFVSPKAPVPPAPRAPVLPQTPVVPEKPAPPATPAVAPTWGAPSVSSVASTDVAPPVETTPEETVSVAREDLLETRPSPEDAQEAVFNPDEEVTGVYSFDAPVEVEAPVAEEKEWIADEPTEAGGEWMPDEPTDPGFSLPEEKIPGVEEFEAAPEEILEVDDEVDTQTGILFPAEEEIPAAQEYVSEDEADVDAATIELSSPVELPVEETLEADAAGKQEPGTPSPDEEDDDSVSDPYAETIPPDYGSGDDVRARRLPEDVEALVGAVLGRSTDAGVPDRKPRELDESGLDAEEDTPEFSVEAELEGVLTEDEPEISVSEDMSAPDIESRTPAADFSAAGEVEPPPAEDEEEAEPVEPAAPELRMEEEAPLSESPFDMGPEEDRAAELEGGVEDAAPEEAVAGLVQEIEETSELSPEMEAEPPAEEEPEPDEETGVFEEDKTVHAIQQPVFIDEGDPFLMDVAPSVEVLPASVRSKSVRAADNSLALKLTAEGAIVESGEVRALDIEVPVPGSWIGNRRVTLQLRLTLSPAPEEEDE